LAQKIHNFQRKNTPFQLRKHVILEKKFFVGKTHMNRNVLAFQGDFLYVESILILNCVVVRYIC